MKLTELISNCESSECEQCVSYDECSKYVNAIEIINRRYNQKFKLSTSPSDFYETVHALYSLALEEF